jgi:hypothetical protein
MWVLNPDLSEAFWDQVTSHALQIDRRWKALKGTPTATAVNDSTGDY